MKKHVSIIALFLSLSLHMKCDNELIKEKLESCPEVTGRQISSHKCYTIPKAIFRGVLWPSDEEPYFLVWLIKDGNEKFIEIDCSENFYSKRSLESSMEISLDTLGQDINYKVKFKESKHMYLNITLPSSKKGYDISAYESMDDDTIIAYMDLSEDIVDHGHFGIFIIE